MECVEEGRLLYCTTGIILYKSSLSHHGGLSDAHEANRRLAPVIRLAESQPRILSKGRELTGPPFKHACGVNETALVTTL